MAKEMSAITPKIPSIHTRIFSRIGLIPVWESGRPVSLGIVIPEVEELELVELLVVSALVIVTDKRKAMHIPRVDITIFLFLI